MLVQARFKDAPEDEWFEVLLTEDHRMFRKDNRQEITRTDLQFRANEDDDEIIDMEDEWEKYRTEMLRKDLHRQATYLARQAMSYNEKENLAE